MERHRRAAVVRVDNKPVGPGRDACLNTMGRKFAGKGVREQAARPWAGGRAARIMYAGRLEGARQGRLAVGWHQGAGGAGDAHLARHEARDLRDVHATEG